MLLLQDTPSGCLFGHAHCLPPLISLTSVPCTGAWPPGSAQLPTGKDADKHKLHWSESVVSPSSAAAYTALHAFMQCMQSTLSPVITRCSCRFHP